MPLRKRLRCSDRNGVGQVTSCIELPNLPYFPAVYYAIMKAGAAVVPICVLFTPREIAYQLRDSTPKPSSFRRYAGMPSANRQKNIRGWKLRASDRYDQGSGRHQPDSAHKTLTQAIYANPKNSKHIRQNDDTCAILKRPVRRSAERGGTHAP